MLDFSQFSLDSISSRERKYDCRMDYKDRTLFIDGLKAGLDKGNQEGIAFGRKQVISDIETLLGDIDSGVVSFSESSIRENLRGLIERYS